MILHWLAGYSLIRLVTIASGIFICAFSVARLFGWQIGKRQYPRLFSVTSLLLGICLTVATLLRGKGHWDGFSDVVMLVCFVLGGINLYLMKQQVSNINAVVLPPCETAPSDKIWPPPPTSHP
jgi:hypothetical protein